MRPMSDNEKDNKAKDKAALIAAARALRNKKPSAFQENRMAELARNRKPGKGQQFTAGPSRSKPRGRG